MTLQEATQRNHSTWIATVCGLADSLAWITFALTVPTDLYYGLAIGVKLALLVIQGKVYSSHKLLAIFLFPAILSAFLSVLFGFSPWSSLLQVLPFAASLSLTLALINERVCRTYFVAVSYSIYACIVVYLLFWATGRLESEWGRWLFLGGEQPNLGGEIFYSGVLSAAISTRLRSFYFLSLILLALFATQLLQARSALISTFLLGMIALNFVLAKKSSVPSRLMLLAFTLATLALLVQLFTEGGIEGTVTSWLLLDNEYRGLGTGFVNRDARWALAWDTFQQYPLFGIGFGNERVLGEAAPHNYWLYMISEMGLLSLVSLYALLRSGYNLFTHNRFVFMFLCTALILTVFNDRFINMNTYPFLLYVMLFMKDGAWTLAPLTSRPRPFAGRNLQPRPSLN